MRVQSALSNNGSLQEPTLGYLRFNGKGAIAALVYHKPWNHIWVFKQLWPCASNHSVPPGTHDVFGTWWTQIPLVTSVLTELNQNQLRLWQNGLWFGYAYVYYRNLWQHFLKRCLPVMYVYVSDKFCRVHFFLLSLTFSVNVNITQNALLQNILTFYFG